MAMLSKNEGCILVDNLQEIILMDSYFNTLKKLLFGSIMIKRLNLCNNSPLIMKGGGRTSVQKRSASREFSYVTLNSNKRVTFS